LALAVENSSTSKVNFSLFIFPTRVAHGWWEGGWGEKSLFSLAVSFGVPEA